MLNNKLIDQGLWLFKFRGQFPILILFLSLISVFFDSTQVSRQNLYLAQGIGYVFIGIGFCIRFWVVGFRSTFSSGRNRTHHHTEVLEKKGWYSVCRNPLYLGNYLMWLGLIVGLANLYLIAIVSLIYWVYIERIIFSEEVYLSNKFKEEYIAWCESTPVFFPNFTLWKTNPNSFSFKTVLKNEYPGISAAMSCAFLVELMNTYSVEQQLEISSTHICIGIAIATFGFGMKFLKHKTRFFKEFD